MKPHDSLNLLCSTPVGALAFDFRFASMWVFAHKDPFTRRFCIKDRTAQDLCGALSRASSSFRLPRIVVNYNVTTTHLVTCVP